MQFFKAFLAISILLTGIYFGTKQVDIKIHSCSIYTPSPLDAGLGISRSLLQFISIEGWEELWNMGKQFVKSEVLQQAPYYGVEELQGKRLLMIGGGYIPEFLRHAKLLGVEIDLVDAPKMESRASPLVRKFTGVPDFGRVSIQQPQIIQQMVIDMGIKYDGVFTLVEDEGPLVSLLQKTLGVVGNSEESSAIARNKFKMRKAMQDAGLPVPKFALIESEADLEKAAQSVTLPAFLKPNFGVAASFAAKVKNMTHLIATYREYQSEMDPDSHSIFFYGQQMILEETLDGAEIQLELFVHNGEVVYHCFSSEYSPERDWLVFPVNLTETTKSDMLTLASKTVKAIGITQGIVHVEMFSSSKGPQIIEVNNRLSRGFLPRRFAHQLVFGEKVTDYFGAVIFLALGLQPPAYPRTVPLVSISLFLDNPSANGWETEGPCAIFFGESPSNVLQQGKKWQATL
eukprot:TRINITY_DN10390_c0_g1_i1.p1 TRINITY_DN10390_c0_g1~~TRINITY_DN10390_c0_g1_i1.p1  ORF type:complete len:458 (+),score=98.93 TRINITY_DN10390_c0_g1_i1:100-1473(+)